MLIKSVRWDSKFFGQKIGKITSLDFDISSFDREKNKFSLIYILDYTSNPGSRLPFPIKHFEDKKHVYIKQLNGSASLPAEINCFSNRNPNQKLIELALQCGEFSRFKRDRKFSKKSYEELYTKWIQNSTNKKLAFVVLVYGDVNDPEGFITLQRCKDTAHVGLFAVNNEARNKGIGRKLLEAAEYYAGKENFTKLSVTTQADNKRACRLYARCGYSIESTINTYHYWNKDHTE